MNAYLPASFLFTTLHTLASLTLNYLLRNLLLFCYTRRLKRNQNIIQDFVPLVCNYRSNKRLFSFLPSNLRGRQVIYHMSIVPCVNSSYTLFVYNKLSHTIYNVPTNKNKLSGLTNLLAFCLRRIIVSEFFVTYAWFVALRKH